MFMEEEELFNRRVIVKIILSICLVIFVLHLDSHVSTSEVFAGLFAWYGILSSYFFCKDATGSWIAGGISFFIILCIVGIISSIGNDTGSLLAQIPALVFFLGGVFVDIVIVIVNFVFK